MNLENLSVGLRVPNYRKLCALLGENVEAGNSKEAQLRRWEQLFAYRREKNAYIITEIYSSPKPSNDRRMKFAQNLIPIIQHHLALSGAEERMFEGWFAAFGMVEATLFDEHRREEICADFDLTPFQMQKLVYTVESFCKRVLLSSLDILKKEQIVNYEIKEYIVRARSRWQADEEELKAIQNCKDTVLSTMGVRDMFPIQVNPGRRIQFYDSLNALYKERHGWDRTYSILEISPVDTGRIGQYETTDVASMMEFLNGEIKSAVVKKLRAENENADQKSMDVWESGGTSFPFQMDPMVVNRLIHVLHNEL